MSDDQIQGSVPSDMSSDQSDASHSNSAQSQLDLISANVSRFGYAGDVSETDAFSALSQNSLVVDVRTRAEWSFVGVPAIAPERLVLSEWQAFPDMQVQPDFAQKTAQEVFARSGAKSAEEAPTLFFLCRSGARSRSAAIAMTEAGFAQCFNIQNGFEGVPNEHGHRGIVNGWKASNLPWRQS